jgi:hypothetical protein
VFCSFCCCCLSFNSLRAGKTLSQIAAAASSSSSSEKDKTQTSSKLQTRPRIIKHTEELTPKKKKQTNKQTNKALQLLFGFLNSACKEKVSQIAAVATSSSSSSSATAEE